jgi:predicted nucleic acid-binding protein
MTQTVGNKIFVDTNILVYSSLNLFPLYGRANQRMAELMAQNNEIWLSRQVIREYIVNMTRPGIISGAITREEVLNNIQIFSAAFKVADETKEVTDNLINLLRQVNVVGSKIYDTNIVATMQAYNITHILTHNVVDFTNYSSFITVLPLI